MRVSVKSAQMSPVEETPALSPELMVQAIGAPSWARPGPQRGRFQPSGHLQGPGRSPETQRGERSEAEEGRVTAPVGAWDSLWFRGLQLPPKRIGK